MGHKQTKGWEFWLGAGFVAVAVCLIAPAYIDPVWRDIVSKVGAATAALAVVGASLIAYDGSVAKVRFDRNVELSRRASRKFNLLIKLRFATDYLVREGAVTKDTVKHASLIRRHNLDKTVSSMDFAFPEPEGIGELWDNLDEFPPACIEQLGIIRIRLAQYAKLAEGLNAMLDQKETPFQMINARQEPMIEIVDLVVAASQRIHTILQQDKELGKHEGRASSHSL